MNGRHSALVGVQALGCRDRLKPELQRGSRVPARISAVIGLLALGAMAPTCSVAEVREVPP